MSIEKRTVKVKLPAYRYEDIAAAAAILGVPVADFMAEAAAEVADTVATAHTDTVDQIADGLAAIREDIADAGDLPGVAEITAEVDLVAEASRAIGDHHGDRAELAAACLRRLTETDARLTALRTGDRS